MAEERGFPLWRRCENAWAEWLEHNGAAIMRLTDATSNTAHSGAPLMQVGGRRRRAPDLMSTALGRSEYWEVKTRTRADVDVLTGRTNHWMPYAAFDDYAAIYEHTRTPLWVILYESATATGPGRWLQIEIERMREVGSLADRWVAEGKKVEAWMWPVSEMRVVEGPAVDETDTIGSLAPFENDAAHAVPLNDLAPVERDLRRRRTHRPDSREAPGADSDRFGEMEPGRRLHEWLDSEPAIALDVLRRQLGVPTMPRYSVLRVGLAGVDVDQLLGLLHYGIRVFLVAESDPAWSMEVAVLDAFRSARLLEVAVVSAAAGCSAWIVDGAIPDQIDDELVRALDGADDSGEMNLAQFRIVHASPADDIVVEAGAGTGKTETMSERIIYLLAVSGRQDVKGHAQPRDLRVDEIALVTFTREASAQMRERLARTLLIRQRLCRRCALPALAWMLQLSSADISTIHGLARSIVASSAGSLGLGPDFRVARLNMELGEAIQRQVSDGLADLVGRYPQRVPAAYEWQNHVAALWSVLENNGVDLLRLPADAHAARVDLDWGGANDGELEASVNELVRATLLAIADELRQTCVRQQVLSTNQLVPSATAALKAQDDPPVRRYRYIFVDEFQDSDPAQMDLFLSLRTYLNAPLFVVGDVKQGIYRFRGASGDAFVELRRGAKEQGLPKLKAFPLTRNFRSGGALLGSLHPVFSRWGAKSWLPYDDNARLRPQTTGTADTSAPVVRRVVGFGQEASAAAEIVDAWWAQHPGESIGILCRHNWQAVEVQHAVRTLRPDGQTRCDILVGGSFFQSPAVRELRAFLEAVADPEDDAALLELCETRWGAALLQEVAPDDILAGEWGLGSTAPVDWMGRFAELGSVKNLRRDDLVALRHRVIHFGRLLRVLPVMSWLVECDRILEPARYSLPGLDEGTERERYIRCLDHLITLLDAQFEDSPLSLERLLGWVRAQIATNNVEDEPDLSPQGRITALTVHKAKGLEFDRVVVPWTTTQFGPPRNASTRAAVRGAANETPRLLWSWKPHNGEFTNVPTAGQAEWEAEAMDTMREEARLLYVAMTRARRELVMFVDPRVRPGPPKTWQGLLQDGTG